ncbi:MAG: VOC family protein [Propionibacteriaceae bacterium]
MTQTNPPPPGGPDPLSWQLSIDANDPHRLADFWAAALQAEVEDNTALITELMAKGWVEESDTLIHDSRRSWTNLVAVQGAGPRLLFQRVPEEKTTKNRLHLDLNVGSDRLQEEVARLQALGAVQGKEWKDPSGHWFVMHDPEGNEFCVQ